MAKITTPVTEPSQIQSVLGYSGIADYGTIMTLPTINKWAKCKPIHHTALGALTDEQRRGTPTDIANGIIYGLKVSASATMLKDLHDATWEYVSKPTGDINTSPYRPWDFVGYDHDATPTLRGEGINAEAYFNVDYPFGILLFWNITNNTTGIDVAECILGVSGSPDLNYEHLYLCILIDGYMTALINTHVAVTANTNYAPIKYGDTYCNTFSCPELPDELKSAATRRVTIVATDYENAQVFMGSWENVADDALYSGVYVTIPDLAGISVKFSESTSSNDYGSWSAGGAIVNPMGTALNVTFSMDTAPTVDSNYKVILEFGGFSADVKTFSVEAGGLAPILSWSTSELPVIPISGSEYTVYAMLYGVGTADDTLLATMDTSVTWP